MYVKFNPLLPFTSLFSQIAGTHTISETQLLCIPFYMKLIHLNNDPSSSSEKGIQAANK